MERLSSLASRVAGGRSEADVVDKRRAGRLIAGDQHRTASLVHDPVADAAQDRAYDATAARAHDDQVDLPHIGDILVHPVTPLQRLLRTWPLRFSVMAPTQSPLKSR